MDEPINYYVILDLPMDASLTDVKRAYRKMALRWHPDKHPKDKRARAEEEFKRVSEAFQVLSDPEARRNHDLELQSYGTDQQDTYEDVPKPSSRQEQSHEERAGGHFFKTTEFTKTFMGNFADMSADDLFQQIKTKYNLNGTAGFAFRSAEEVFKEFFSDANNNVSDDAFDDVVDSNLFGSLKAHNSNREPKECFTKTVTVHPDGTTETVETHTKYEININYT